MVPDWAATPTDAPYANFGNPQSLNLYSYVKNNPTTVGDPDGHDGWDFVGGLANAFATDFFGGAARKDSSNKDYQAGQNVGDALAVDVGALEALGGAAVDVASIPLDAVGVGEVIQVGATAGAVQGATAVFTGGAHVVKAAINAKGSQGGPTAGQRFSDKDRAKDAGKNCVYCKQETTEKPGQPNSRETDHIHPASRNGNATSRNRALVSYCGVVELHFQQLAFTHRRPHCARPQGNWLLSFISSSISLLSIPLESDFPSTYYRCGRQPNANVYLRQPESDHQRTVQLVRAA